MYPESGGVVSTVERAWAEQLVAMAFEAVVKVVDFEHLCDADLLFEVFKESAVHTVLPCNKISGQLEQAFPVSVSRRLYRCAGKGKG